MDLGSGWFDDEVLYLTYHSSEDVWPWHTNNFALTNVQGPFGE